MLLDVPGCHTIRDALERDRFCQPGKESVGVMSLHRIGQPSFREGGSQILDDIELPSEGADLMDKIGSVIETSFRKYARLRFVQLELFASLIRLQHTKPVNSRVNSYCLMWSCSAFINHDCRFANPRATTPACVARGYRRQYIVRWWQSNDDRREAARPSMIRPLDA